jgi:hypothetical protein
MTVNDFLNAKIFRVCKRSQLNERHERIDYGEKGIFLFVIKENLTLREARNLKNELNRLRTEKEEVEIYYCFEKMSKCLHYDVCITPQLEMNLKFIEDVCKTDEHKKCVDFIGRVWAKEGSEEYNKTKAYLENERQMRGLR